MNDWTSDFIITISVIISSITVRLLPKKVKMVWRIAVTLIFAIFLSIIGHLMVKFFTK